MGLFTEYQKMENSFAKLKVTKDAEKAKWGVFEKIHGANFSFHIIVKDDGKKVVKAARRRAILGDNENFFNHLDAEFMKTTPDKMKQVYDDVVKRMPADKGIKSVAVWGEIYGGENNIVEFFFFFADIFPTRRIYINSQSLIWS